MFSYSPNSIKPAVQPRAAYTDFTPAGPWTDGTAVTRNSDGVGFTYSAALNALTINPNLSASVKDANNFIIKNLPAPTNAADAANKNYVDTHAGSGGGAPPSTVNPLMNGVAAPGTATPYSREDHVHPSDTSRAPLASPTFTGTPAAPTASVDTNTTQVATTAFVIAQASATGDGTPGMDGTAARGSAIHWARADHVHPTDTSRAPLASPVFTGNPTAPTPVVDDNDQSLATTAYVIGQASASGDGTPAMDGTAARGVAIHWARTDHVHPTDTTRAPLASPNLTGTPVAPTAAVDTNTTQLATTAYVIGQASASGDGTPNMDGTASRGTSTHFARADHIHPSDTTKLSDAPSDGTTYGRKNGAWSATAGAGAIIIRSYLAGLTLSTAGASTTFSIAAGVACDSTVADMLSLASSISKTTGAWAVGTGNGALDTGTIAASTWYHAYLIKRPDTQVVDVLVSLSASAPTLPTNYTLFRRIGAMRTNASSQWTKFTQLGDEFIWDVVTGDVSVNNPGTAAVSRSLTVPTSVQVLAVMNIEVIVDPTNSAPDCTGLITPLDIADAAVTQANCNIGGKSATTDTRFATQIRVRTNTSGQVRSRFLQSAANTYLGISTSGWFDRRGKDN